MVTNNVSEAVKRFYSKIQTTDWLENLEIPHSDAYYLRWLLWEKTGVWYLVDHCNLALWLEGYVSPDEIKSVPEWYVNQYMKGQAPDITALRIKVRKLYNQRQEELNSEKVVDTP